MIRHSKNNQTMIIMAPVQSLLKPVRTTLQKSGTGIQLRLLSLDKYTKPSFRPISWPIDKK